MACRRRQLRAAATSAASEPLGECDVREAGEQAGKELSREVDRQLLPLHGAACDLLDEHRAEGSGRVDRGACRRSYGNDGCEHDQTDGEPGESSRRLVVDDSEDREDQDERADELGGEGLADADRVGVRRDAEPTSLAF